MGLRKGVHAFGQKLEMLRNAYCHGQKQAIETAYGTFKRKFPSHHENKGTLRANHRRSSSH